MQTRSQKFAVDVFPRVEAQQGADKTHKTQYGGMAYKLPILILSAGLAQALAFADSRGKGGAQVLLQDLAQTLQQDDLLKFSRQANLREYRRLTQEALEALLWYKRFAQSVLKVDATAANNEAITEEIIPEVDTAVPAGGGA